MYLGYHWFTDTVGSVCLSLVLLATVIALDALHARSYDAGRPGGGTRTFATEPGKGFPVKREKSPLAAILGLCAALLLSGCYAPAEGTRTE